ncbi:hypothetical protein KJ059_08365 [Myxococcota bacterium]|nr:hypothetical protein [Myxococcota bacterium]
MLERLDFSKAPDPDRTGLARVYRARCQRVPYDNVHQRYIDTGSMR